MFGGLGMNRKGEWLRKSEIAARNATMVATITFVGTHVIRSTFRTSTAGDDLAWGHSMSHSPPKISK